MPYTAVGVAAMIITEMGALEMTPEGIGLAELHPDDTVGKSRQPRKRRWSSGPTASGRWYAKPIIIYIKDLACEKGMALFFGQVEHMGNDHSTRFVGSVEKQVDDRYAIHIMHLFKNGRGNDARAAENRIDMDHCIHDPVLDVI